MPERAPPVLENVHQLSGSLISWVLQARIDDIVHVHTP